MAAISSDAIAPLPTYSQSRAFLIIDSLFHNYKKLPSFGFVKIGVLTKTNLLIESLDDIFRVY